MPLVSLLANDTQEKQTLIMKSALVESRARIHFYIAPNILICGNPGASDVKRAVSIIMVVL